ncbi:barstar family protein [Massilia violaceinigra]|uniref:barstar family protein n=1 Tax=Massilia violaceinigra TaxID=2045208 RepID=UPI0012FE0D12|nr:barstar family protein [Massilia violaceinigra]
MKKYILDCAAVKTEGDFWDLYCKVVGPEGEEYFGRNLSAFWDAVSAGGPGWPGKCEIELINVRALTVELPLLFTGLRRIAEDLMAGVGVKILLPGVP